MKNMFYSLFIFTLGIYIGQEYSTVPSVKKCLINTLNYIKEYETETETKAKQTESSDSSYINMINLDTLKDFFKKTD